MYLLGKRVDNLTEQDILRLKTDEIEENKFIEYKRDLEFKPADKKKEFLFDITAMYNTEGGCIIFGVEEKNGIPENFTGIEIDNSDDLKLKIDNTISTGVEPRINIIYNILKVENVSILILGIPQSIGLPAMVKFNSTNKFYKRRNNGKYLVDVYELNDMFLESNTLIKRAKKFRKKRIYNVLNNEVYPDLDTNTSFFIHVIPFSFIKNSLDISNIKSFFNTENMSPYHSNGYSHTFNLDGFCTFHKSFKDSKNKIVSYNQLFRNGIYEIYTSLLFYETHKNISVFDGVGLKKSVPEGIKNALSILNKLNIGPPFFISFSMHNIYGKSVEGNIFFLGQGCSRTLRSCRRSTCAGTWLAAGWQKLISTGRPSVDWATTRTA